MVRANSSSILRVLAIVVCGVVLAWVAAFASVGLGSDSPIEAAPSPGSTAEAARVLAESDRAMAAAPFVREERIDVSPAPNPNTGKVEVWQYEGDRYRIAGGGGSACTWFPTGLETHGSPAFSQRARGGAFPGMQPGGTPADQLRLQRGEYKGGEALVLSFHFKTPTVEGPDDVSETDWIDPQTYRLLRSVQTIDSQLGSSGVTSSVLLYPPEGRLRDCPSNPALSAAALKPLPTPGA